MVLIYMWTEALQTDLLSRPSTTWRSEWGPSSATWSNWWALCWTCCASPAVLASGWRIPSSTCWIRSCLTWSSPREKVGVDQHRAAWTINYLYCLTDCSTWGRTAVCADVVTWLPLVLTGLCIDRVHFMCLLFNSTPWAAAKVIPMCAHTIGK